MWPHDAPSPNGPPLTSANASLAGRANSPLVRGVFEEGALGAGGYVGQLRQPVVAAGGGAQLLVGDPRPHPEHLWRPPVLFRLLELGHVVCTHRRSPLLFNAAHWSNHIWWENSKHICLFHPMPIALSLTIVIIFFYSSYRCFFLMNFCVSLYGVLECRERRLQMKCNIIIINIIIISGTRCGRMWKNYQNPWCTRERRAAPRCTLVGQRTRPLLLCLLSSSLLFSSLLFPFSTRVLGQMCCRFCVTLRFPSWPGERGNKTSSGLKW